MLQLCRNLAAGCTASGSRLWLAATSSGHLHLLFVLWVYISENHIRKKLPNRCIACMSPDRFRRLLRLERTAPLCMEAVQRMSNARICNAAVLLFTSLHSTPHIPQHKQSLGPCFRAP